MGSQKTPTTRGTRGPAAGDLLLDLPTNLPAELHERLAEGRRFRLDRIVSTGQVSPPGHWYEQREVEWVLLLSGRARLRLRDPERVVELSPGGWIELPARCAHRVEWTDPGEPTVWLALYFEL